MALAAAMALFAPAAQAQDGLQLDFLAGEWTLHDSGGTPVGRARITVQAPGAMIYEERTVGDQPMQPLWFENAERSGGWTQLFVGPRNQVREFTTLSEPGAWPLIFGGDVVRRDGTPARFRLTLTRQSDDESRRVLEISTDGGLSWQIVFDYRYVRAT
jgi:hypothetical protein